MRLPARRHLVTVAVAALTGACGDATFGTPRPGTQQGEDIVDLWRVLFWAAVAVGALVVGLILWAVLRYRGGDAQRLPVQTRGNVPLEVLWTALPLLLAGALFALSVRTEADTKHVSDDPDLVVEVTGFQWQWRFVYPEQDVTVLGGPDDIPELVLPVDRVVRLDLRAADVVHSFFVPGFIGKKDLVPGLDNEMELRPVRTGRFLGHCAEFCGLRHAAMNFDVRVVPPREFDRWLAAQRAGA